MQSTLITPESSLTNWAAIPDASHAVYDGRRRWTAVDGGLLLASGSAARSGETGRGVLQRATPDPWGKPTAYGCDDSDGVVAGQLQFILRLKRLSTRWSGGEGTQLSVRGVVAAARPFSSKSIPDEDRRCSARLAASSDVGRRPDPRNQDFGSMPDMKLAPKRTGGRSDDSRSAPRSATPSA